MHLSTRTGLSTLSTAALAAALLAAPSAAAEQSSAAPTRQAAAADYVVLLEEGASRAAGLAAIRAAGGTVVTENRDLGTVVARGPASGFSTEVSRSAAVVGAAHNTVVGRVPDLQARELRRVQDVEKEHRLAGRVAGAPATSGARARADRSVGMDPLDDRLWGLRMVRSDLARMKNAGDPRVKVGILDSGIDARNPDLAPNVDLRLSRNFAPDLPEIDGPCEFRGCVDPADWDDSGHGTHVAGTVAAAANGLGVSGVAPEVTLVNIRGGQDSGYLFLGPVTEALTYGANIGLDVINMSFYVDPWLYNCLDNPADSPEAQAEQRTIIATMRRALTYAHNKGVTLVGALGNNHEDLGDPRVDTSSPDFPPGEAYPRPIDNATCFDLPVEGPHVLGIAALGPSGVKADYSNYGLEQNDLSAPGGYYRDYVGTPWFSTNENLILSTYPVNALQAEGAVDEDGDITELGESFGTFKACPEGATSYLQCGYYTYLQGTSMASPHASGVAALAVSEFGRFAGTRGFGMDPDRVARILKRTAADRACPTPRTVDYLDEGRSEEYTATCRGGRERNGFYGHGIVDAYAVVTYRP